MDAISLKASNRSLYIYPQSNDWLTDSMNHCIICPHNYCQLGKVGKKTYAGQTLTRFQAASHLDNAPWRQQPGVCLLEGRNEHLSQKTINLSIVIPVKTWWESPTWWEKQIFNIMVLIQVLVTPIFLGGWSMEPYLSSSAKLAVLLWIYLSSSSLVQIYPFQ